MNKRKPVEQPNLPVIREVTEATPGYIFQGLQAGTKAYKMGALRIFISPPYMGQGWHMSISHRDRYPTWDEIAHVRYALLPETLNFVMHLPRPDEYVALHDYCFHLHEAPSVTDLADAVQMLRVINHPSVPSIIKRLQS